jgi:hypothetical protein
MDFDKNFVIAEIFRIVKNKMGSKYWLNMATDIACAKKYYCTMQEGTDLCKIKALTKIEKKIVKKTPDKSNVKVATKPKEVKPKLKTTTNNDY